VQNNNLYPVEGATAFFGTLPNGVVSSVAGPFTINALGTSVQYVTITTSGLAPGFYPAVLNVESSTDATQTNVQLPIGISSAPLQVTIGTPVVSYSFSSGTQVAVQFPVTNNELGTLNLSSYVDGMPTDWTQQVDPAFAVVAPGDNASFQINLESPNSPTSDYNVSLVVLSSSGRLSRIPLQISPLSASAATGFFTLGNSNTVLAIILGLLILCAALFYLARNWLEQTPVNSQPAAQPTRPN